MRDCEMGVRELGWETTRHRQTLAKSRSMRAKRTRLANNWEKYTCTTTLVSVKAWDRIHGAPSRDFSTLDRDYDGVGKRTPCHPSCPCSSRRERQWSRRTVGTCRCCTLVHARRTCTPVYTCVCMCSFTPQCAYLASAGIQLYNLTLTCLLINTSSALTPHIIRLSLSHTQASQRLIRPDFMSTCLHVRWAASCCRRRTPSNSYRTRKAPEGSQGRSPRRDYWWTWCAEKKQKIKLK